MQSTTIPQPQSIPERWHRVIGRVQRFKHVETTRQTGPAGTYIGFACGLTYSAAEVSDAYRHDRVCGRCAKAMKVAPERAHGIDARYEAFVADAEPSFEDRAR